MCCCARLANLHISGFSFPQSRNACHLPQLPRSGIVQEFWHWFNDSRFSCVLWLHYIAWNKANGMMASSGRWFWLCPTAVEFSHCALPTYSGGNGDIPEANQHSSLKRKSCLLKDHKKNLTLLHPAFPWNQCHASYCQWDASCLRMFWFFSWLLLTTLCQYNNASGGVATFFVCLLKQWFAYKKSKAASLLQEKWSKEQILGNGKKRTQTDRQPQEKSSAIFLGTLRNPAHS